MKKFAVAALLLVLCASPAFARHKKIHKDARAGEHPKGLHVKNQQYKQRTKAKKHKRANT